MREHDPVLCQPGIDGETMIWFVTRHEDAAAVLLDDERFVRDPRLALTEEELAADPLPPAFELIENHMLNRDGDDHRRLRRLVTKAFTPKMVEQLRPRIQAIADELLDAVEARGEMDLSAEYAFPLPITVIAEMLGVPAADHDRFKEWSDAIITPVFEDEEMERFFAQMGEFVAYLTEFFAARRAEPQDDLVSALLAARDEEDALTEEELFGTVVLLIVAGHETTVGLIGNAVVNLLVQPGSAGARPSRPVAPSRRDRGGASLRGAGRAGLNRWAAADVELGGQTIRRGELVIAIVNAADRDPRRFPGARPPRRPPGGHAPPRLRPRQPLLPRATAGAARGSRSLGPFPPLAVWSSPCGVSSNGGRRPRDSAAAAHRPAGCLVEPQSGSTTSDQGSHLPDGRLPLAHTGARIAARAPDLACNLHLAFRHAVDRDDRASGVTRVSAPTGVAAASFDHQTSDSLAGPRGAMPKAIGDPVPRLLERRPLQCRGRELEPASARAQTASWSPPMPATISPSTRIGTSLP